MHTLKTQRHYYMVDSKFVVDDPYLGLMQWNPETELWEHAPELTKLYEQAESVSEKEFKHYAEALKYLDYMLREHLAGTVFSPLLDKAEEIALYAHKGQKDKAGKDYAGHLLRTRNRGKTEIEKICGVLHDLIEDTGWTFEALEREGFPQEVIDVLRCVTKQSEDEDYDRFIDRVATNPVAVQVKINDLLDNMDITRFRQLDEKDMKRLNKYLKAYWSLKEINK
jgi:(p)ppGpp synthase/HD superfamily hydrolase